MRNYILVGFILCLIFSANAQRYPFYSYYELEENPTQSNYDTEDQIYFYTKYLQTVEYEYDAYYQSFFKYNTLHYRVHLTTDAAIEEYNKVYISMEDVYAIKNVTARVIKADEVLDVDIQMEEFFSEDEDETYNYFAISGLELGDEVEVFYTLKMEPALNGDQFYFQGEIPIYNFDFRFIAPNDAYFNFLAHNGLPQPELIDTILQRHQYDIHLDTIPAFKEEYFSEYTNVTMKLDASLKDVDGGFGSAYSPYIVFADFANEVFNVTPSGKSKKYLKRLNERLGVSRTNSEIDNIRKIENYMKNEFLIGYGESDMSIDKMIKEGKGDGTGSLQLFMGLLNQANIRFEYGLISDRYDTYFSPEIESDYFLQNYFMFFPDSDAYLAPLDFGSRVGYLDYKWVPNYGLFLRSERYPYRKTEYEVRKVSNNRPEANKDSTILTINVNESLTDAEILIERYITGYDAGEHQVYYYLYSESKRKEVQDDLLDVFNDNSSYHLSAIENVGPEDAFVKPLIIKGNVTSLYVPLFEKAGEKTIFRLGEIFGEYINPKEMDRKKSDFVFAHSFSRTIEVNVNFPKAVRIANTDQVPVFDKLVDLEDTRVSSEFKTTATTLYYKQRDEYMSQRYSIDDKEALIEIFQFHTNLGKINLIIEEEN